MSSIRYTEWPNNNHLKQVESFFGETSRYYNGHSGVDRYVFLCFTNRSGSNYLAEILASDGTLPRAGEKLNWDVVVEQSRKFGLGSIQEYFSHLSRRSAKSRTVALKVAPPQIEMLAKAGVFDAVMSRSYFLVIERSDKLAQAISHEIAFQTKNFTSLMESSRPAVEPEFRPERIDRVIDNIARSYVYFQKFFSRNGVVPVQVSYEQLVDDPSHTLGFIARHIGIDDLSLNREALRLERQAGPRNQVWRRNYLMESAT